MTSKKVAIIGATGGTGAALVEAALAGGYEAIAVARRPEAVTNKSARLTFRRADVLKPESLAAAISGADAVVSAVGIGRATEPTHFFSDGITNIIRAMNQTKKRRLICVGASGYIDEPRHPLYIKLIMSYLIRPILRHNYDDLQRMEEVVKTSGLDWTIVRPPRLTNGRQTKNYRVQNEVVSGGAKIARADVADYIINILAAPDTFRKIIGVAY